MIHFRVSGVLPKVQGFWLGVEVQVLEFGSGSALLMFVQPWHPQFRRPLSREPPWAESCIAVGEMRSSHLTRGSVEPGWVPLLLLPLSLLLSALSCWGAATSTETVVVAFRPSTRRASSAARCAGSADLAYLTEPKRANHGRPPFMNFPSDPPDTISSCHQQSSRQDRVKTQTSLPFAAPSSKWKSD